MTAVLSATDPLARDRVMPSSNDTNEIECVHLPLSSRLSALASAFTHVSLSLHSYSSTDYRYWKEKYLEEADIVRETQAELDEFQVSSKELEAELESDLARTEKAKLDFMIKVERAETERDDWKVRPSSCVVKGNLWPIHDSLSTGKVRGASDHA